MQHLPHDINFSTLFEEVQVALVEKEEKVQALSNINEMLMKKLAQKEEEIASLKAMLKGKSLTSLSHTIESHSQSTA